MVPSGIPILGITRPTFSSSISRKRTVLSLFRVWLKVVCLSVGVGYSYADYGETVETTEDAAKNVHAFISIFFETFSEFSGRPIHLSGESYGVKSLHITWIPSIGY